MIENTNSKIVYQGDGEVRTFSVPFPFLKTGDIAAVLIAPDGTQTPLDKDAQYSTQIDAQGVATITLSEPPVHGWSLCIYRTQEITQEISLVENARFPSAVIESGFDRIVMAQQNQQESIHRALKAPVQENPDVAQVTLPMAALRKNSVLGWDSEGNMIAYPNPEAARQAAGHSAAQAALSENACAQAREAAEEALDHCETLTETTMENAQAAIEALERTSQISDSTMRAVSSFAASYAFRGTWNANTPPSPNLAGDWWIIAGNCSFGAVTWQTNDRAVWGGSSWIKLAPLGDYKTEMEARIQGDANASSRQALELTSGYLTIPGSAPHLAKLPVSICITYTKRANWGATETLFSNVKTYTRAGYAPKAGVYLQVQNAGTPRTVLVTQLNSQNIDNDAYSVSQFDLLPTGTHTICVVIEPFYNNGTTNSPTLPQKVSLYVDGSQWTPVNKNGLGAEYKAKTTAASTLESPCQYYGDSPGADLCISDFYQANKANIHVSRILALNFALPALALSAVTSYRYSVEQYALGEPIPEKLMMGKDITSGMTAYGNVNSASLGTLSFVGLAGTLNLITDTAEGNPAQVEWHYQTNNTTIPTGIYFHAQLTSTILPRNGYYSLNIRLSSASGQVATTESGLLTIIKDGVPLPGIPAGQYGTSCSVSSAGVFDIYGKLINTNTAPLSEFACVINSNVQNGVAARGIYSGGAITLNKFEVFGAITALDQPFKGGNLLPDSGLLKLPGVIEGQTPKALQPIIYTDLASWNGDNLAKAILSALTTVIPANAKLTISAKPSATVTLNITNGAVSPTTLISGKALTANVWNDVGSFFTTEASKLAAIPTAPTPYTGTIQLQVKIEPLL